MKQCLFIYRLCYDIIGGIINSIRFYLEYAISDIFLWVTKQKTDHSADSLFVG